ncbi:MAG: uroporphyrinogen-III synthase [Holophaga sp.]|nr:uroporphyrinogen-III synthase [Holophaga sp.]
MVIRLGLARGPEETLSRSIRKAGWEPVFWGVTELRPAHSKVPFSPARAAIVLSPAGAKAARLPVGIPCLVTGDATGKAIQGHEVTVSPEPRAEGLWAMLRSRYPEGGDFLLVRGERTRGFLEEVAEGSPWRLHPWITHQEAALDPVPARPELDAVLALSPLQAEVMAALTQDVLRFAWGERTGMAFEAAGTPAHAVCEPTTEALGRILASYL